MRHVVNSLTVAHLWAHQTQSEAHNQNRSVFFRCGVIYSYGDHFPIARHVTSKSGSPAVLFTTASYSVTTSEHCSMVRSAIPSSVPVFNVPNVYAKIKAEHEGNLANYAKRISESLLKAARARQEFSREWKHKEAIELRAEAIEYAEFFRVPYAKTLPVVPALDSEALRKIKQTANTKAANERREAIERNRERVEQWRQGEYVGSFGSNLPDMLRVSQDGQSIETSRGVSFPISHAKRGLALVRAVRNSGETWHTNGHTCKLGYYQIDSITPDGTVKAGCHTVRWAEIERIAPVIDAAPSVLESLQTEAQA